MLRVTSNSVNMEGVISNESEVDVATVSGSVSLDNLYVNMHSYDVATAIAAKAEIAKDVAEFTTMLLER